MARLRLVIPAFLALVLLTGCAAGGRGFSASGAGPARQTGLASYYADRFHGRPTASGEIYDMNALTAAHRTLPFGTRVRVTNLRNGRQVELRIIDRGPFVKDRVIDVSWRAAQVLDFVAEGVIDVRLDVLAAGR